MFNKVISSPIRWAGSKKRLLNEMLDKMFIRNKENYIECFLGSGVVLLNVLNNKDILNYQKFYVNDINSNIINFYVELRDNAKFLIGKLKKIESVYNSKSLEEKENFYYEIRRKFNSLKKNDKQKSIYFYFLMKAGFNGVYRENRKGDFNVPFGKKEFIIIPEENLWMISNLIQPVVFYNLDYKEFINVIKDKCNLKNSFIYCDPPYIPDDLLVYQKQILYTNESFNHNEFYDFMNKLDDTNIMISMSDSTNASIVYEKNNFSKIDISKIIRTVNPKKMFTSREIAYINYKIKDKN